MFKSDYQLILHPEDHNASLDALDLKKILLDIGFIERLNSATRFTTGEHFLSLLCFLGCSPDIELDPQDDKPYIYIDLPPIQPSLEFISGKNIKPPRCPTCRKDLTKLAESLQQQKDKLSAHCEHCDSLLAPASLNWRKSACFLHSAIIIGNIYEAEAVPDSRLLDALKAKTGERWKYCYITKARPSLLWTKELCN